MVAIIGTDELNVEIEIAAKVCKRLYQWTRVPQPLALMGNIALM